MKNKDNLLKIFRAFIVIISFMFLYNEIFGISIIKKMTYPLMNILSNTTIKSINFIDEKYINDAKDEKIKQLEEENKKLKKQLIDNSFSKKELQQLTDLKKTLKYFEEKIFDNYIVADIIAKNSNSFYTNFIISAGSKEGIKKGDLVLSGDGIIGIVEKSESNYSKVLSLLDSNVSFSFKSVREEEINGIVSQNITADVFKNIKQGLLKGYVFDDSQVLVGDMVVTSGMGEYPQGIAIGEVFEIFEDDENLLKYITVKPYTDFNNITKVMVVSSRVID